MRIIEQSNPILIVLDDVAGSNEEFYSLQNYYGFLQINRFLNLQKLIADVCGMGYRLSIHRPYSKKFSKRMVAKIWLGTVEGIDCETPLPVTLVFQRTYV